MTLQEKLTVKQEKFVQAYDGNACEAAEKAGYPKGRGYFLMKNPSIIRAIQNRTRSIREGIIYTREQRQEFWTKIIMDTNQSIKYRLKASELLAKSEGDFIIRHELSGPNGSPIELQVESDESIRDRIVSLATRFRSGTDPEAGRN